MKKHYPLLILLVFPWSTVQYDIICSNRIFEFGESAAIAAAKQAERLGYSGYECSQMGSLFVPPTNPHEIDWISTIVINLIITFILFLPYYYLRIRFVPKEIEKGVRISYFDNGRIWNRITPTDEINVFLKETFYDNGNLKYKGLSKGNKINGVSFGEWEFYYENGNLKEKGEFKPTGANGILKPSFEKDGPWETYNENGEFVKTEIYKNGKLV